MNITDNRVVSPAADNQSARPVVRAAASEKDAGTAPRRTGTADSTDTAASGAGNAGGATTRRDAATLQNAPAGEKSPVATSPALIHVGVDVGSTTTKAVVLAPGSTEPLYARYKRHSARQAESVQQVINEIQERFPAARIRMAVCGSGGRGVADALGVPFIQEVVANAVAVQRLYPAARTAIELGGQDAKMIFFRKNEKTGNLDVADMRMNGSCAGGTGAFLDEIAKLLSVTPEEFEPLAAQGTTVYDISGRCGVFAKTDIQPLLNNGVSRADLALSACHAIAKQSIGGLAQGLDITAPVIFEGGPLTFNPTLIRAFRERLGLDEQDAILPAHPEVIVAEGAALALDGLFAEATADVEPQRARELLAQASREAAAEARSGEAFFESPDERRAFEKRHALAPEPPAPEELAARGVTEVKAYLGLDSGSTTTKLAFVTPEGEVAASFYANNEGDPLAVATRALTAIRDRFRAAGVALTVLGCGTTGYGEAMFARAFHADYHTVETVAHARAARAYVPDASFVLDIGGQDMKGIWLENGIVTDIEVNEACSSGCGSFLENFASTLGIPVTGIAEAAFRADHPAVLGSRCTVFMNSSVVNEQRNGKTPDDIMAGLARSIVENVFTKVIRLSNTSSLGDKIVVQGGTFRNDAVLRALEQYLDREVTRAPYPGLMGAIGIALLTQEKLEAAPKDRNLTAFIGLDALDDFSYTQQTGVRCPFCGNHCSRTLVTFSDGTTWVTGNRCPKGQVVGDPRDAETRERLRAAENAAYGAPNLFELRRKLLFQDWPVRPVCAPRRQTVGLPRVLALWDNAPFWTTLLRALGFDVLLSPESTRHMYEDGLSAVPSDTVCFPAKLVHGHLRWLARKGVDRIFMPVVTTVPTENTAKTSESMCAVVKGYPLVIKNSDNPEERFGIPFDAPLFHWLSDRDQVRQLTAYLRDAFNVSEKDAHDAIRQAEAAQEAFRDQLVQAGEKVIDDAEAAGSYAVVLASRPYHSDPLVNHSLPELFAAQGIPVMPPDAVPGVNDVDLTKSRLDVVNNFHARMLGSALLAAESDAMEYVQLVSFGCGHDAYLSDEIKRLMRLTSHKTPLILKVDESDAQGPLRIRVRSFVETVNMRRLAEGAVAARALPDPYPAKFEKRDFSQRTVLVPNTSHAFSMVMAAALAREGLRTESLPVGGERAAELGKKYVHNDICFPAQIVIGEALEALVDGERDPGKTAIMMAKYVGDCRLTHYAALLRKALNDAGFEDVPIVTNDDADDHDMHPGYRLGIQGSLCIAAALPMIDALEELLRKIRPYELEPGSTETAFEAGVEAICAGMRSQGIRGSLKGFEHAMDLMCAVRYDRSRPRPTVLIVGEYLLNFHPGANRHVEAYLEANGMEVIEARMTDVIRKTYFYQHAQDREYHVTRPLKARTWNAVADNAFDVAHALTDRIACRHPLYEPATRMEDLVRASDPIIHHTFDAGEGVLIPAEILHHAEHGCQAFLILQPFGCLPNHVVGRGIVKKLRELYPNAQILSLDYDPDMSMANIENRLQMLIMNAQK